MTMPASGKISLFDARTELGLAGAISLQQSEVRGLFDVPSGAISLFDGYGKSAAPTGPYWVTNGVTSKNTVYYPSGIQANDIILLLSGGLGFSVPTIPSGFTSLASSSGASAGVARISYRRAVGNETGSVLISNDDISVMMLFRGCDTETAPISHGSQKFTGSAVTTPGFTTSRDSSLAVGACYASDANVVFDPITPTPGWDEILDEATAAKVVLFAQTQLFATSGSTVAESTINLSTAQAKWNSFSVELRSPV